MDYPTLDENMLRWGELVTELLERQDAEIKELQRGMAALAEVMATATDLEDVRREMLERTATPFDPPTAA